ncbi:amidohydrolase [Prauserella oleivorans]|uniref:Amidohydrolase n=1 Tax=Prauserella oleivorans TaxID=1478153 RepID=A0ABW5W7C3_9PSEU
MGNSRAAHVLAGLDARLPALERLYVDLHRHPELAFAETRTAAVVARRLRADGYTVHTGIGGTGVAGVLRRGDGPTVLLRADMDALPVEERTGLAYASTARAVDTEGRQVPVMHACGHDMHVTWLCGAASLLAEVRASWSGTLVAVFQPAEEVGRGARAMIDDGLFDRVGTPDVVFGQHVTPAPAGWVLTRPDVLMAATDALRVTLHGRGGHGSRPETTVDPAVLAASVVLRLQTIVSRELAATEQAVVTVGSLHVGSAHNVIADDATLDLDIRSFTPEVRTRVLAAVERIVRAEADAAAASRPPDITPIASFPVTRNDPAATERVRAAFEEHFPDGRVWDAPLITGSEDVGDFGAAAGAASVFWLVGGGDERRVLDALATGRFETDVPSNHSSLFAPVPHPTLRTGVEALVVAALDRLRAPGVA